MCSLSINVYSFWTIIISLVYLPVLAAYIVEVVTGAEPAVKRSNHRYASQ